MCLTDDDDFLIILVDVEDVGDDAEIIDSEEVVLLLSLLLLRLLLLLLVVGSALTLSGTRSLRWKPDGLSRSGSLRCHGGTSAAGGEVDVVGVVGGAEVFMVPVVFGLLGLLPSMGDGD